MLSTERHVAEVRPSFAVEFDNGILFLSAAGEEIGLHRAREVVRARIHAAHVGKRSSLHLFWHSVANLMLKGAADVRFILQMLGDAEDLQYRALHQRLNPPAAHASTPTASALAEHRRGDEDDYVAGNDDTGRLLLVLAAEDADGGETPGNRATLPARTSRSQPARSPCLHALPRQRPPPIVSHPTITSDYTIPFDYTTAPTTLLDRSIPISRPDICTAVPAENVVQRYATVAEISTHGESSPGQYVAEVRTQRHATTQALYGSSPSVAASQARPLCCDICTFDVTRHLVRVRRPSSCASPPHA
jgi:hypothetical protein